MRLQQRLLTPRTHGLTSLILGILVSVTAGVGCKSEATTTDSPKPDARVSTVDSGVPDVQTKDIATAQDIAPDTAKDALNEQPSTVQDVVQEQDSEPQPFDGIETVSLKTSWIFDYANVQFGEQALHTNSQGVISSPTFIGYYGAASVSIPPEGKPRTIAMKDTTLQDAPRVVIIQQVVEEQGNALKKPVIALRMLQSEFETGDVNVGWDDTATAAIIVVYPPSNENPSAKPCAAALAKGTIRILSDTFPTNNASSGAVTLAIEGSQLKLVSTTGLPISSKISGFIAEEKLSPECP